MVQISGSVGVVGLGEMGGAIASRLISQGVHVLGVDTNLDAGRFDSPYFTRADSIATVSTQCEFILVIVHTDDQVRDVVLGDGGLAESAQPGTTVVVHSTVDPATCAALAPELLARRLGLLDAGMSRGRGSMRDGSLTLFVGGQSDVVQRTHPLFEVYSDNVVHAGPVGHGMVLKLCNNLLLHTNRLATLEVAHIAAAAGVEREPLLQGVRSSTGTSWVVENWGDKDEKTSGGGLGEHPLTHRTTREVDLALQMAGRLGVALPATTATGQHLTDILTRGLAAHTGAKARDEAGEDARRRNSEVIEEFRAQGGRLTGSRASSQLLLLTTMGARTGLLRTSPMTYLPEGDHIFVFATNGGSTKHPAWYRNILANPKVIVELGDEPFAALATEMPENLRAQIYARQVARRPEFADYADQSCRAVPVIRLQRNGN